MSTIEIILLVLGIANLIGIIFVALKLKGGKSSVKVEDVERVVHNDSDYQMKRVGEQMAALNTSIINGIVANSATQKGSIDSITKVVSDNMERQDKRQDLFMKSVETKLENIKTGVEKTLADVRKDNNEQLDKMRHVVEEKLQSTLNERLNQSFGLISEKLEKVHQGLGEMAKLTSGVDDLRHVLSGVKTRGVWGEVSLHGLLDQVMAPGQYEENVRLGEEGSREAVEFALVLPGKKEGKVYMPIDAKFPLEDYQRLVDAQDRGEKEEVEAASKALEARIKDEAKAISKYIRPPKTTDFAVMYLPIEGLFAEVVRRVGLQDEIHSKYRVLITGPTTLSALLNSLQVGFRTMTIQQRSREIYEILTTFKTDFTKFTALIEETQKHMDKAADTIRTASTKTLAIQKRLSKVELIDAPDENDV